MHSMIEREQQVLFQTYNRLPLVPSRAEGCRIYDQNGAGYIDCVSGLGAMALGHSHPKIIDAIARQSREYLHLSNLFVQEPQIRLAEALTEFSGLDRVFFCNSGTEAIEGAVKLVRRATKDRPGAIVALEGGFHGRTLAALSMMAKPLYKENMGPFGEGFAIVNELDLDALQEALNNASAVVFEPIKGEGGIRPLSDGVVRALQEAQQQGVLLVADEIQSGFGRTGEPFGYHVLGIEPDIVTVAKAIGGGLPLGAILAKEHVAAAFGKGHHGTTFGGNSAACAAGLVVVEELRSGLLEHVRLTSTVFAKHLHALADNVRVKEVRVHGLMIGIELKEEAAPYVRSLLEEHHVIANATSGNTIRLLPPLVIDEQDIAEVCKAISSVLV